MAKLKIVDGPKPGREIEIFPGTICIGRQTDCDIQLLENSLSRKHANIEYREDYWFLKDLGSQNGSFVDDQPVVEKKLDHGDHIRLGNVVLQFFDDVSPQAGDTGLITPLRQSSPSPRAGESPRAKSAIEPETGTGKPVVDRAVAPSEEPLSGQASVELIGEMGAIYERVKEQFARGIVGQEQVLEQILVAVAANGHCLMIGLPGLAKTLMVSTLARILQLHFKRIQFTPDLMPSDILGTEVLDVNEVTGEKSFRFIQGPVFTNMLLADEINRTPPKTQAALLESMQERQVTVANHTFRLPSPFFVLATQNPLEQEGTYPLPEAQLDRFMFNITVDYPSTDEEEEIVARTTVESGESASTVLSARETLDLQRAVRALPVSRHVIKYATALARATRPEAEEAPSFVREHVFCGAGPRAAQYLVLGAKARAVLNGRVNVSCEDVRSLALPVMRHRVFTNFTADSEGIAADDLIRRVLQTVSEPRAEDYLT